MRRYIGLEVLAKSRPTLVQADSNEASTVEEVATTAITASGPPKDHVVPSSTTTSADVTETSCRDPDSLQGAA